LYGLGEPSYDVGLLEPGGFLAVTADGLVPLHKPIEAAWPLTAFADG
jgi:hypothetical protein